MTGWLLALALFGCFFLATQDVASPSIWRDEGDSDIAGWVANVEGGRGARQVAFLALAGLGTLGLLLPRRDDGTRVRVVWPAFYPLLALALLAAASVLWSHDRPLTAKRLVLLYAVASTAAAAWKHFAPRDVAFAAIVYALLSYAVGVYAELKYGGQSAGTEPWRLAGSMHPNHLALTSAVLGLALLWTAAEAEGRKRMLALAGVGLAFAVIVATRSRTSLATACVGWAAFCAMRLRPAHATLAAAGGVAAGVLGLFLFESGAMGRVWEAALMGRSGSDVRTLTGRTDIWAFAVERLTADPARFMLGFGHDSFWNADATAAVSRRVGFTISEAHCAYLEITLNLGIAGGVAYVLALFTGGCRWLADRAEPAAAFGVGMVVLAAVHSLVESTFAHAQFVTFVLLCVLLHAALPREEAS